jgi:dolichol-phosphate mannosyltransferase
MNPCLSVVIPLYNEAGNVLPLAGEVFAALDGEDFELLLVDDASTDATLAEMRQARAALGPRLRILRHRRRAGQSTALLTGVRAARSPWVASLDGDGQNDPADIPRLLARLREPGFAPGVQLVIGDRRRGRHDRWLRRVSSRVANAVRNAVLHDGVPDSGCGLKLLRRDAFLALPYFDHMHRFLPVLVRQAGGQVLSVPVSHRPRLRGQSKYGVANRLFVGIVDLFGVAWLGRRNRHTECLIEEPETFPS